MISVGTRLFMMFCMAALGWLRFRSSPPLLTLEAGGQAMARSNLDHKSRNVEAIKVHNLIPSRDKVVDKLLLSVRTSVDFSQGAELRV